MLRDAGAGLLCISSHTKSAACLLRGARRGVLKPCTLDGVRFGHRAVGAGDGIAEMYENRAEGFGPEVQRRVMIGTYVLSAGFYMPTQPRAGTHSTKKILKMFAAGVDAILTPATPSAAFGLGEMMQIRKCIKRCVYCDSELGRIAGYLGSCRIMHKVCHWVFS